MNWNFDTIFFLGFGIICLYLGLSGSKWLFWGGKSAEKLQKSLGENYKKIINISCGLVSLAIGAWFMLR